MKSFSILLVTSLIIASNGLLSQTRPPQNIRKVTVTSQYEIVNGQKTDKMWAVYQEIYDSLGRLHTEIEYDFKDHYPHNYKWHTFIGKQVAHTDYFESEKLKLARYFTYNNDSLVSKEVIKLIKPGDTSIYATLSYKYNPQRKPVLVEAIGKNGKSVFKSKYTYDSKGTELTRVVNIKKGYSPLDSIVELICKPKYDSLDRLTEKLISITKVNKPKTTQTIKYSYDRKNNIIGITNLDNNGKQINREERLFQESRNRLMIIKYYDSNDRLVKWLEKRYEIYRTKDRRIHEIDY